MLDFRRKIIWEGGKVKQSISWRKEMNIGELLQRNLQKAINYTKIGLLQETQRNLNKAMQNKITELKKYNKELEARNLVTSPTNAPGITQAGSRNLKSALMR